MKRAILIALSVILALSVAAPVASAGGSSQKPNLRNLSAAWWNWAAENPTQSSPLVGDYSGGEKCDGSNPTGVWFLAGEIFLEEDAGGGLIGEATRKCTVPAKTKMFFPVFNILCSEAYPTDPTPYTKCAKDFLDQALTESHPVAKVDGRNVPIRRAASGLFIWKIPTSDNPFGVPAAGRYEAATDGLWVLLPPLPKGKHKVVFGGEFTNPFGEGKISLNTTYNLTVKRDKRC